MKARISLDLYIDDTTLANWNKEQFEWNCRNRGLNDEEAKLEISHNNYLNALLEEIEDYITDNSVIVFHSESTSLEGDVLLGLNEVSNGTATK